MKLQDLKYGMYAVDTSGREFLCIGNNTLISADNFNYGFNFNEDLEYKKFGYVTIKIDRVLDNERYIIWKRKEFKYPIYKRSKLSGNIVRFNSISSGEVVFIGSNNKVYTVGDYSDGWHDHTNINSWEEEDILFDEERGLFDKQLVWCWDKGSKFFRCVKFYDAKNRTTFNYDDGRRKGCSYLNYEPFEGEYPQWAKEDYKNLED